MGILRVILIVVALPSTVRAEFIIDDFDDSVQVSSPEMRLDYIHSPDIGPYAIDRYVTWSGPFEMVAHADANVRTASTFSATMVELNASESSLFPVGTAIVLYQDIPDVDFTEGGASDALVIDVSSVTGPTPPSFIRARVWEANHPGLSFFAVLEPIPATDSAISLVLPFDIFFSRGDGSTLADFSRVTQLQLEVFGNGHFGLPEELGWTLEIDRIRVGAVPEPATWALAIFGLSWFSMNRTFRLRSPAL